MFLRIFCSVPFALTAMAALAGPPLREDFEHRKQVLEQIAKSLPGENDAGKLAILTQALANESDSVLRRNILDVAAGVPAPVQEQLYTALLSAESDSGLRSQAATALGKIGSEKCFEDLAKLAATDRITGSRTGCLELMQSARRPAIFALAQLAERLPNLAEKATAELRSLKIAATDEEKQTLSEARQQALYQITRDESLIQPYFDQLKSDDAKVRQNGVIAFRFLKLMQTPPQLVEALRDGDQEVSSWAALVLGVIGDPQSAEPLMQAAADGKLNASVRCNAIGALGRMKIAAAGDLMEKLLADPDGAVSANAAVALYRITGKKSKQFPEGYNAD